MESPNRKQLDRDAGEALADLSERQRKEARRLMGNPPRFENIPAEAWARWEEELNAEIAVILLLVFADSSMHHGASEEDAYTWARGWVPQQASQTARQLIGTARDQLGTAAQQWTNRLNSGESLDDIDQDVDHVVNRVFGPSRMNRAGVDAVTVAQTAGGERSIMEMLGHNPEDWWENKPSDSMSGPCPTCSALHGKPRYVWELEYPMGPGPWVHPGCVCNIRYVNLDNAENN